jgi:hypothetical protein
VPHAVIEIRFMSRKFNSVSLGNLTRLMHDGRF